MKNIRQAEWTHWNVRTLPVEWKNHLQHMSTKMWLSGNRWWAKKTGLFMRADNFEVFNVREACNMSAPLKLRPYGAIQMSILLLL